MFTSQPPERFDPTNATQVTYDLALHLYRYSLLEAKIAEIQPKRLLDCACGPGYGAQILNNITQYTGLDISEEAVNYSRSHFSDYGSFVQYAGGRFPFDDSSFDFASSLETIEHLHKVDHTKFLNEFARVMKPGALLFLTTPSRLYTWKRFMKRHGWFNPFHFFEYTPDELHSFVEHSDVFEVVETFTLGLPVPLPMRRLGLNRLPSGFALGLATFWVRMGRLTRSSANTIVLVARRRG